jgi:glycosyltransferase involved in cell wall biosynthesis
LLISTSLIKVLIISSFIRLIAFLDGKRVKDLISVLLPALGKEMTRESVIDGIPISQLKDKGFDVEIMVVYGHSKDRIQEIAKKKRCLVITQYRKGEGLGIRTAFEAFDGDYLDMMDVDDTYPGYHILDMFPLLQSGKYDIILGSRLNGAILLGAMNRLIT